MLHPLGLRFTSGLQDPLTACPPAGMGFIPPHPSPPPRPPPRPAPLPAPLPPPRPALASAWGRLVRWYREILHAGW